MSESDRDRREFLKASGTAAAIAAASGVMGSGVATADDQRKKEESLLASINRKDHSNGRDQ